MVHLTERIRILSLLAAVGELSSEKGEPLDGVELCDQNTSHSFLLSAPHRPFASLTSLRDHGYMGDDEAEMREDFVRLIGGNYIALKVLHDGWALTPAGLAVYEGHAEFHWDKSIR
ncbi:MAG TPA: hypothetical protein VFG89_04155 [Coriobacteriia bacterium]|nr:hypothetical protein [Coriobacteriia bacterium]